MVLRRVREDFWVKKGPWNWGVGWEKVFVPRAELVLILWAVL